MDAVVLGLRVILSLAVVLGLLWFLHRKISRFNRNGNQADPVTVVTRQGISPKASVVMIEADGRRFLLGVTDQSVNVLHTSAAPGLTSVPALSDDDDRTDPDGATFARVLSLATANRPRPSQAHRSQPAHQAHPAATYPAATRADAKRSGRRAVRPAATRSPSPLAGSILSPGTWKQTAAALRQGRTG